MAQKRHSNFAIWALLGLSLLIFSSVGFLLLQRVKSAESRFAVVNSRLAEITLEMKQIRDAAETARTRAIEAEEFARLAAEGRERAEAIREISEAQVARAKAEVEQARESAEMAQEELERLRKERNQEMNRLQRALSKIASTRRTPRGVVMSLNSDTVKFDFDEDKLRPEYKELLSRIAGILLTTSGYRVQIYGHTDNIGTAAYNQELSERRARSVRNYLVDAGIESEIIGTKGFGKSNPLVPGTTPEARAKNRRVEIGIIDTMVSYEGLAEEKKADSE